MRCPWIILNTFTGHSILEMHWTLLSAIQSATERPFPLTLGETFSKKLETPSEKETISKFWSGHPRRGSRRLILDWGFPTIIWKSWSWFEFWPKIIHLNSFLTTICCCGDDRKLASSMAHSPHNLKNPGSCTSSINAMHQWKKKNLQSGRRLKCMAL